MRAGELPAPKLGHLPSKLVDCCPRVAPGRGRATKPWNRRRGLASPGPGRESATQTGIPARNETATPRDSGTEPGTGTGRETGAGGGTGTGTGRGTGNLARTGPGPGTIAAANKEFGKTPARVGRGTDPGGRPGTRPRPPGPRRWKPRSHRPCGRRASDAEDPKVNPLQGDTHSRTPGLDYRKWYITSQRLKGSWNATSADTCAPGEV